MQWWRFACPKCAEGTIGYTIREAVEDDPKELVWDPKTFLFHGDGVTKTKLHDNVFCDSCDSMVLFHDMKPWHITRCDDAMSELLTSRLDHIYAQKGDRDRFGRDDRVEPSDSPRHAFEHGVRFSGSCGLSDNPYVVIECYDLADIWEEGRQLGIAIREGRA